MYERGAFKELSDQGFDGTWLEWFLKETETFHGTSSYLSYNSICSRKSVLKPLPLQLKLDGTLGRSLPHGSRNAPHSQPALSRHLFLVFILVRSHVKALMNTLSHPTSPDLFSRN